MTENPKRAGDKSAKIASALRADIISGVFKPGHVLRQEALAKRFQSSRMPVRDGLRILEQEGLVILPTNRGAQVAPLDADSLREISEMRASAEHLALTLAIPELTNRHLELATEIQDQAEAASIEQFSALNKAFHFTLIKSCNRPRLLAHIASLTELNERYIRLAAKELEYEKQSHTEHRMLLDACFRRDTGKACHLLTEHISSATRTLLANISKTPT